MKTRSTTLAAPLTLIVCAEADPSETPALSVTEKGKYVERFRILVDLDGDGQRDMLLSGGPQTFGNAGGHWFVYLKRGDDFENAGDLFAHPKAIAIEPDAKRSMKKAEDKRHARIWTYLRGGAGAGQIGYYRVGDKVVDDLAHIEIYISDGYDGIGKSIYDAVFRAPSPIPFELERSTTSEEGKVTWSPSSR